MTLNQINSFFQVKANLYPDIPGAQGNVEKNIGDDLKDLNLDSLYTKAFLPADINSLPWRYYSFPTVDRTINGTGAVVETGDDKQPLLLNSIHAIAIRVIENESATSTGYIQLSLKKVGSAGATAIIHKFEAGESAVFLSRRGWPAHADTEVIVTGVSLTNATVHLALVGHTSNTGTGYS